MYVNPQSLQINNGKIIKTERTKGGYIVHYWGEELTSITIQGNTGSSGIEGINVLHDVYRGEQLAFDYVALQEVAKHQENQDVFGILPGVGDIFNIGSQFANNSTQSSVYAIPKPTLGFYASTVEMYYMGAVYRGYFENFNVTENTSELGMFTYSINFKATSKRGTRKNFMAWHHKANIGPSQHTNAQLSFPRDPPLPPPAAPPI